MTTTAYAEQTKLLIDELRSRGDDLSARAAAEIDRLHASRRRNLAATVANAKPEAIEKFWAQVDKSGGPDACWPWLGRCNKDGYGHCFIGGKSDKRAHRVACALVGKEQPPHTEADHQCKNRACCNPAHIEFVSHRQNSLNSNSPHARNAAKTECSHGHAYTPENTADYRGGRMCLTCYPWYWKHAVVPRAKPPRGYTAGMKKRRMS